MLNGKVISTKLLSRDTYDAMTKVVLKGTKAVTTQTTTPVEPQTPTTQEPEIQTPSEVQQPEATPPTNPGTETSPTQETE